MIMICHLLHQMPINNIREEDILMTELILSLSCMIMAINTSLYRVSKYLSLSLMLVINSINNKSIDI